MSIKNVNMYNAIMKTVQHITSDVKILINKKYMTGSPLRERECECVRTNRTTSSFFFLSNIREKSGRGWNVESNQRTDVLRGGWVTVVAGGWGAARRWQILETGCDRWAGGHTPLWSSYLMETQHKHHGRTGSAPSCRTAPFYTKFTCNMLMFVMISH